MVAFAGVIGLVIRIISILIVLYVFEMTKAVVSSLQGDDTPRSSKMLTLNIFKYFEPIGFMLTFFFGYGWGKPAPVSARLYKNRKAGVLLTYSAPIILSVILAVLLNFASVKLYTYASNGALVVLGLFCGTLATYFLNIAVFNIIPIPPMCGYEILRSFLPPNSAFQLGQNAPLIQMGFLFLWFFNIVPPLLDGVVAALSKVLFG